MRIIVIAAILLAAAGNFVSAQVRTEDVRVRPPESWPKREVYGLDITLGGSYLRGNVENSGISGGLDFNTTISRRHQIFIQASKDYAEFNDLVLVDKDKASLLYAYKIRERWNIFVNTTHAHNEAIKLKYRTTNGGGVCYHSFLSGLLDPVLLSAAIMPEYETFKDGVTHTPTRGNFRLNFGYPVTSHFAAGADLMYMPRLTRFADYRMYGEAYFKFKITDNTLDFKMTVTDEYESRPRPGVKFNDLITGFALVVKLGK
ncbi:MAG: hypothetical protein A2X28_10255 [Elusimicrobia bacterium GWA2_56_46]|nr:MAG: hypothetical protein A2X28_10255 [Elusimicrobia bacterium GWA2_56_46]OGR55965.1 MAG: hypothetical protein A2X39_05205 [Elusimicrobia bacterium GWC2_56_31]